MFEWQHAIKQCRALHKICSRPPPRKPADGVKPDRKDHTISGDFSNGHEWAIPAETKPLVLCLWLRE